MLTITQLREKIANLLDEDATIRKTAVNQQRGLSEGEKNRITEILDEVEALEKDLDRELRAAAVRERLDGPPEGSNPPKIDPADNLEGRASVPPKAKRPAPRPEDRFMSLGEQCQRIAAAVTQGFVDPRLHAIRAATGLSEGVPSGGGFLLQDDFSDEILRKVYDNSVVLSRVRRMTLADRTQTMKIPAISESSRADGSRHGGVRGYWTDEAADKTASKPKFKRIELTPDKLTVLIYATDELLADVAALDQYLTMLATEELDFKTSDAIINGDGAGKPLGILNSGCLVSVAAEGGQAAATILYDNVVNMWSRAWARSRPGMVWLINQDIEPQLFKMSLAVGTGGTAVFVPAGGASAQPYSTLFGRPVLPVEFCPTLGTVGDIVLADLSQYFLADKGAVQSASSIHVEFVADETVFRFIYRVDGQPWWTSALTPYSGSTNTLSPFVALATRS